MIRHIIRKDWKLLWPMVALVTAIQIGLDWAIFASGLFGENPAALELIRPLTLAWFIGIAALAITLVHQDAIPGADQDWLIRPVSRRDLLLAKLSFMALAIGLPMFATNLVHALAMGFPLAMSLDAMSYKELYVFACFIAPVFALAAATRNTMELILVGAALVVVFAVSMCVSAFALGAHRCPTCNTGLSWIQHVLQHLGILGGAAIILGLQYYRRRTGLSRTLAMIGAAALVFVQLPWNAAFAVQQWASGSPGSAAAVTIGLDQAQANADDAGSGPRDTSGGSRQATRALLHGDVDQAVEYLRRRTLRRDRPVPLLLPLRISGVAADELLLLDRTEVRLLDGGRTVYAGVDTEQSPASLRPQAGEAGASDPAYQSIGIPGSVYRGAASRAPRLRMDYSLTLMKVIAQHRLAAIDGELRSPEIGLCASKLDRDSIRLRCKQLERAPFCYSATLYAPDGRHNPEVLSCSPDYRPYLPSLTNALSFFGIDVPVRDRYGLAHYAVDASELGQSYVLLKIYGEGDHFRRTLDVSPASLSELSTRLKRSGTVR